MSLLELEQTYIRPLTRAEKWQLITDIQEMLKREEATAKLTVENIFTPGMVYEIATPSIAPCDNDTKAAAQLRALLEEQPT